MNSDEALPLSLEQKLDQVCTRFEAAWKSNVRPRIEEYLVDLDDGEKREVMRELILLVLPVVIDVSLEQLFR